MLTAIVALVLLSILVLIHEFGHFIAAKRSGVLVEEFGLGFPPRVFGKKIGETIYSINLLPLGGFVKVFGEEYQETEKNLPQLPTAEQQKLKSRAFVYKKPWQKSVILVAGILMNVVLGVTIFYLLLASNGFRSEPIPLIGNYTFRFGSTEKRIIIAQTSKNSPAQKAGAQAGDQVLQVRSSSASSWSQIYSPDDLIHYVNNFPHENIQITLVNVANNERKILQVTPEYNKDLKRSVIGVSLADAVILKYDTPVQKALSGFLHSYNLMAYNFTTLRTLISSSFAERSIGPVSGAVSGPIGIFGIIQETVNTSGKKLLINLANITALLSLSLGVMNVLPFPALDGGRLMFVVYEWIARRRPNYRVERAINMIGFIFLLSLMFLISFSDIIKRIHQ